MSPVSAPEGVVRPAAVTSVPDNTSQLHWSCRFTVVCDHANPETIKAKISTILFMLLICSIAVNFLSGIKFGQSTMLVVGFDLRALIIVILIFCFFLLIVVIIVVIIVIDRHRTGPGGYLPVCYDRTNITY